MVVSCEVSQIYNTWMHTCHSYGRSGIMFLISLANCWWHLMHLIRAHFNTKWTLVCQEWETNCLNMNTLLIMKLVAKESTHSEMQMSSFKKSHHQSKCFRHISDPHILMCTRCNMSNPVVWTSASDSAALFILDHAFLKWFPLQCVFSVKT